MKKIPVPPREVLLKAYKTQTFPELTKRFGACETTIRTWLKNYDVEFRGNFKGPHSPRYKHIEFKRVKD